MQNKWIFSACFVHSNFNLCVHWSRRWHNLSLCWYNTHSSFIDKTILLNVPASAVYSRVSHLLFYLQLINNEKYFIIFLVSNYLSLNNFGIKYSIYSKKWWKGLKKESIGIIFRAEFKLCWMVKCYVMLRWFQRRSGE